ncbi:phosphatase PAP2 family protein [Microcella frigidaquae]|uniref:Undecaprenyl-diphosphatase n=2 Tax=Microcella frigidaquae TaxID=424758 RepID=A0A840XNX7_9MICO|nr:phosphatase PAP2 family protein [Microcella frigidaquae]MBB5617619.1 undecaprenyl-diphosphatase [Microcella frigidaquae]
MSSLNRTSGTPPIGAFFGALGLTFVVLTGVIIRSTWQNQPLPIDSWWHDLLAAHRNALADAGARLLNVFGGTWSIVAVVAILIAVLLLRRRWREALRIGVTVAAASGASTVLKLLIARPRPLDGIVDTGLDSFPSGHTTTAAALTVAIALAFPHMWSWVLAAAWVPVMAVSRTYLLVDWATDVLTGAVLGASVALIVAAAITAVFRKTAERNTLRPPQLALRSPVRNPTEWKHSSHDRNPA